MHFILNYWLCLIPNTFIWISGLASKKLVTYKKLNKISNSIMIGVNNFEMLTHANLFKKEI